MFLFKKLENLVFMITESSLIKSYESLSSMQKYFQNYQIKILNNTSIIE